MKTFFISILSIVFFFTPKTAVAQKITGKVIYKVSVPKSFSLLMNKEGLKISEAVKNATAPLDKAIKNNIDKIGFSLAFNQKEALYKLRASLDSEESFGIKAAKISTGAYSSYYYNTIEQVFIKQTEAFGQLFLIESKLNERKWVLTQDSKTIGGYLCYKATSTLVTRNSKGTFYKPITAWYAPKLPVPYGPKGYGGLPGLIMQLTEGDFTFYVSKLTLNPKKAIKIKIPTKGKKVTQKEFEKIGKESSLNFVKMKN